MPGCLVAMVVMVVGILLFSSTGMPGSGKVRVAGIRVAGTTPQFNYTDTWNNIHPFLMFDGY
ncbi:MAG: hypothetical protein ABI406_18830, partial [Ktedonobacteraceae bacterium]